MIKTKVVYAGSQEAPTDTTLVVWIGFRDDRPHVQTQRGEDTLMCYFTNRAAQKVYRDVRATRLKFEGVSLRERVNE